MDQREQVRADIDRRALQLTSKLRALDGRARRLRTRVTKAVDLEVQIQVHPLAAVCAAVGAGYLLGRLLG